MKINHAKVASPTNRVNCDDFNADHAIEGLYGWTLVEEKVLGVGTTSTTFSGLDGDVDEEYMIEFNVTSTITIQDKPIGILPNGTTTNLLTNIMRNWEAGHDNQSVNTSLCATIHGSVGNTLYQNGEIKLFAKTGKPRVGYSRSVSYGPAHTINSTSSFRWNESVTKITNLVFVHEGGSFSGSIKLWKRLTPEGS